MKRESANPFSSSSRISAVRQAVLRSKTTRAVRLWWRSDLIVLDEREATAARKGDEKRNAAELPRSVCAILSLTILTDLGRYPLKFLKPLARQFQNCSHSPSKTIIQLPPTHRKTNESLHYPSHFSPHSSRAVGPIGTVLSTGT